MIEFADDSVISAYLHMLTKTQSDLKMPEYSEVYLRLALKEVFGINFVISSDTLQLYRKLLVLYYCEEFPSLTSVITIMERCFSIEEIYNTIADKNDLLGKWSEFKSSNINKCKEKPKVIPLEEFVTLNKRKRT